MDAVISKGSTSKNWNSDKGKSKIERNTKMGKAKKMVDVINVKHYGNTTKSLIKSEFFEFAERRGFHGKLFHSEGEWDFNLIVPNFDDMTLDDELFVTAIKCASRCKDKTELLVKAIGNINHNVMSSLTMQVSDAECRMLHRDLLIIILVFFMSLTYEDRWIDYKRMYDGCRTLNSKLP